MISEGSDQTAMQADLSLCTSFIVHVGFVMHRLIRKSFVQTLMLNTRDNR